MIMNNFPKRSLGAQFHTLSKFVCFCTSPPPPLPSSIEAVYCLVPISRHIYSSIKFTPLTLISGMPAGNAYPSGHLVPFPIVRLACAPIVETKFLELAVSLLDFSPRIPFSTFSILLLCILNLQYL